MPSSLPTNAQKISWPLDLNTNNYHGWYMGRGRSVKKIIKATIVGNLSTVKECIQKEPGLVHCNIHYREPLYFAVGNNHLDIASHLIENGAEITYKSGNRTHQRTIQRAEDRGFSEMADLLKRKLEGHLNVRYGTEGEVIAKLIREGNLPAVSEMLYLFPDAINAIDHRGNQPIHWAVLTKNIAMIDFLLDRGADLSSQRADGAYPIDLTVGDYFHRGNRMAQFLSGYLVAKGSPYPIEHAARLNDFVRVKKIIEANPKTINALPAYFTWYTSTALNNAASIGAIDIVKYLLQKGADPNLCQPGFAPNGNALMEAIAKKHREIAKILLDHGADPNQAVESSSNCCGWAKNDPELLQRLIEKGGRFGSWENLKNVNPDILIQMFGEIPLRYYTDNDDAPGLEAHLKANPTDATEIFPQTIGNRALMDICLKSNPKAIEGLQPSDAKKLIQNEEFSDLKERALAHTNLSKPNWLGVTELHNIAGYAKPESQIEEADFFMKHGANIEAVDEEYSSTPLGWAAREGQTEMTQYLLEQGANPMGSGQFDWATPLSWARKRGHHETAHIIENYL